MKDHLKLRLQYLYIRNTQWVRFFRRIVEVVKNYLSIRSCPIFRPLDHNLLLEDIQGTKVSRIKVIWLEQCNSVVYFGSRNNERKMHITLWKKVFFHWVNLFMQVHGKPDFHKEMSFTFRKKINGNFLWVKDTFQNSFVLSF